MVALSDFNNSGVTSEVTLSEFNPKKPPSTGLNDATISNVAAHAGALGSGQNLLQTYSDVTNELKSGTASATLTKMLKEQDATDYSASFTALESILADPAISIEEKTAYTQGFANLTSVKSGSRSLSVNVARQGQLSPSEPDDNDEVEFTRLDPNVDLDKVDEYNGWVQKQINAQNAVSSKDGLTTVTSLIETMIPFMEGAAVAKIRQTLDEGLAGKAGGVIQSLTLLGEAKNDIYTALNKMPIETRKEVAGQLIAYIKSSGGSVSIRPNDLIMMNEMNDFLVAGSYSTESRIIDNIFSVMDATVLLSPVAKVGKGLFSAAKSAKEIANIERRATEALARSEPVIEEAATTAIPVAPLDNIINGIRGFDKANADDIADARNVIGQGLDEGLGVEDIINNTRAFDKFTADEIDEARRVLSTPEAHTVPPVDDSVVKSTQDIISDNIINNLSQLDETPSSVYQDIRNAVAEEVNNVSMLNPKVLSRTVLKRVQGVLRENSLTAVNKEIVNSLRKQVEIESATARRSVRTTVAPTSLSQTLKDVNPNRARAAFETVVDDTSGKVAEVTYGTTRVEAIANDTLPEVAEMGGTVRNKVVMDESQPLPDQGIISALKKARGDNHFAKSEKEAMRNEAKAGFRDVVGLVPRNTMASVGDGPVSKLAIDTDTGVTFDMVYGPKDGGFRSPQQAIHQAQFALAKYGVTPKEITILARDNTGNYAPMTVGSVKDGNYLIRVQHDYEFSPADTQAWALTSTTGLRMFDGRTSWTAGKMGGLAQHFIPSTSVVDKLLINAASVASDRTAWLSKRMVELGNEYAGKYRGLDVRQKALVDDYIIEANNLSLKFNPLHLEARGLNDKAVDAIRSWKKVNDTLYFFENRDLNKTLRTRGYMYFVDAKNDTSLIARPIPNRGLDDVVKAYDSASGKIISLDRAEIDALYESGGTFAHTRGSVDIGTETVDTLIVKNNSEASYLRRIRDEDYTLNYRDGHYTVRYTDPYFITKTVKKGGKTRTTAIATSGSLKDATALRERLWATDEVGKAEGAYSIRPDFKKGTTQFEEAEWSSLVSGGRTSQRVRGERLANSTGQQTDPAHVHIESPEESLIRSIGSMSARVAHRDVLDAAKARFMAQFSDLLPDPKGQPMWPDDVRAIGRESDLTVPSSRIKDAKNTWRYIEAIDSGYVNLLDDASKTFFKSVSETAGRKGWGWLETGANKLSEINPTAYARKKAFRLLLAANPLRQAPVQAMQALPVILATNPTMLLTGRLPAQFLLINYINRGGDVDSFMKALAKNATGLDAKQAKQLVADYEASGFEAAVKANSLIRDDLKTLVDRTWVGKASTMAAKPLNFTQKIGFEAGENALMRSVWLSEYDNLRKAGTKMTPEVLENLNARVRNLTLNMNKAGELPYNENMFSAAMQFFQAPHKAFAQIAFGHTGLSTADRIKLGTSYVLTYGIGGSFLLDMASNLLPSDPAIRETIEGGLFNTMMNKALSLVYGEEVRTDFSDSLRLLQFPDVFKFYNTLMTMGIAEALTSSPSLGLVMGSNPRVTNFATALLRPFTVSSDKTAEELVQTGKAFLSMFSGASNFFKAKYIMENQKVISASGIVTDFYANDVEGLMKVAGFSTMDEVHQYAFNEKAYKAGEDFRSDVKHVLDETSKRLAAKDIANDQAEYFIDMMAEAQRVFENDPFYMEEFQKQIFYKATRGESDIFNTVLRLSGFMDEGKLKELIASAPVNEQDRDSLLNIVENIKGAN